MLYQTKRFERAKPPYQQNKQKHCNNKKSYRLNIQQAQKPEGRPNTGDRPPTQSSDAATWCGCVRETSVNYQLLDELI